MGCRMRDLKEKAVISVCDGRCLGNICDFELDPCSGKIEAIFVPGCVSGFFSMKSDDIRIPWDCIKQIGEDAILVEVDIKVNECACCKDSGKKKRFWF